MVKQKTKVVVDSGDVELLVVITVTAMCSVARWRIAVGDGLAINGSRIRIPATPLSSGQVVNTNVPLTPSSIIWYQPMDGDALRLGR